MSATAATHTDSNHYKTVKTVIGPSHLILQHHQSFCCVVCFREGLKKMSEMLTFSKRAEGGEGGDPKVYI